MPKLTDIKAKINELEGGAFQELCDALLSRKGYEGIHAYGMQAGTMKTTKGNPDTYFKSKTGKYIFVAYTTQKDRLFEKAKEDIEKCLNPIKTGIQAIDIEEIIFCHTSSNLSAGEDKALADMCVSKNILFSIYGIDRIADEIYRNHKILAKDYLGITIDTNQILEKIDFVNKYDANEMMAPLSTIFQFRKEEYDEMMSALSCKNVITVIGKAGVGKTRLSLEVAQDFGSQYGYKVFCIKSMDLSISEDVASYIDKPGKYLFLIDDANELIGLKYILEYINMGKMGYDVKIISTLRDYTANKVIDDIKQYTVPHIINIKPFNDKQIKEFLDVNMEIRNENYVEAIIRIAEGNPRIAYMAGKLAKSEQSLKAINDATQLYESYYNKYLLNSAITTDRDLCLTAGIISLLHTINLSNLSYLDYLLEKIDISKEQFIKMVYRLCEDEYVEIKLDKVATISDQCLRNYMLYYAFFNKRVIPFAELLEIGFRSFRNGTITATGILWNIFSSDEVHDYLTKEIEKVWEIFKKESEELFFEFVKYFHAFRPEETLLIAKEKIDKVKSEKIDLNEIDLSKDGFKIDDKIIELLSGYRNHKLLPETIELMCEYVIKKQTVINDTLQCIKTCYSINRNSYKYDYYTVKTIVNTVKEKRTNQIITKLFLGLAHHFLGVFYQPTELGRGKTYTIYKIPLILTNGCKEYRRIIWEELITLSQDNVWEKDIRSILKNYAENWHEEVEKQVFEFDKEFIVKIINKLSLNNEIKYGIICKKLCKKWIRLNVDYNNEFDRLLDCETWKIYDIFADKHWETSLSYKEAKKKRNEEIKSYAMTLPAKEIENIVFELNQIVKELDRERYEIFHGLEIFANALSCDKDRLLVFTQSYFDKGDCLNVSPYMIIKNLITLFDEEYVYKLIWENTFSQRNLWQYVFFYELPTEIISNKWLNRFLNYLEDDGDRAINCSSYRDIKFLDNYISLNPQIYCRVAEIIMKKQRYSQFMVRMYFKSLFNSLTWKPEELEHRFSTDINLLKDIYFYTARLDPHMDYNGTFIKHFICIDNSWIESYAEYFYENIEHSNSYDHDRLLACWDLDNYIEIFDYLFDYLFNYIIDKDEYAKWRIKDAFENVLVHENGKKIRAERQEQWIFHVIKDYTDSKKIIMLFDVLSELGEDIRKKAILLFVQNNKDFELFTKLSLEPNHWGGMGSMIPYMQVRLKFYESLLPYFTGIELLKHKQYIQEHIRIWKMRIEAQEVEELMESLYH
ncbi:MAG: hypothetical protein J1F01_09140 [Oscillospiraceae bacterium]|nr:hypothetical protein [Oscillospiraceae bacterium]